MLQIKIDDEADQASINTNETYDEFGNVLDDYNPTTINGLIRQLLKMFECRSYAGYTATPFANIFIPPHVDSEKYGTDLFPRDFIFRASRADQYIGAREFFGISGDENTPIMPLFRPIEAGAAFLGKGTKATDAVSKIPDELKKASISSPQAMRKITEKSGIDIAFAIHVASGMRAAYFSIGKSSAKKAFPRWKGIDIQIVTLPAYGKKLQLRWVDAITAK